MLNYLISFFLLFFHLLLFFMFLYFLTGGLIFSFKFLFMGVYSFDLMFVFDWISCSFSSFVLLISSVVFVYSVFYMSGDFSVYRYVWILLLFVISMLFLVFSPNIFSLMIGWDGLGLVSFLLVIYYSNFSSLRSGLLTVFTNRLGDLSMMISFFTFFLMTGWGVSSFFFEGSFFLGFFIFLSASTSSAQIPFSSWLPAAMAAPTPVSSLVHSSTLVTAGVYLLIRFYYSLSFFLSSSFFCFMSLITMLFSGLLAFFEMDMKKVVAMSTLSQLGMMMFSISFGEWVLGFFHMICHALFKALLFLSCGGFIFFSQGGQDLRHKGGYLSLTPFFCMMFVFSSLSLCGFPFLSGFYSKDFILESSFGMDWGFMCLFIFFFSCLLSLVYSIRLFIFGLCYFSFLSSSLFMNSEVFSIFFMYLLGSWSMFCGFFFSSFLFIDSFFILTSFLKVLGLLVIFLGSIFYLFFSFIFFSGFLKMLFSDMFFLSWFFGWPITSIINFWGSVSSLDLMWTEFIGPSGFYNFFVVIGDEMVTVEYFSYKMVYVFVGLISSFYIFFIYMCF
uniref:NADH dehydrogenase subunit 5 n=1 Tax=Lebertia trifurcilla TaxID=450597 RepID=UPI002115C04F|nr:NADH dehydrogenase subunit 5 [Lebertia trifurcilla]UTE89511.1 NADH dehydrogenase subunit 5 [Lebertia trifurcilla]